MFSEKMKTIIAVIRKHPKWTNSHSQVDFGDESVGYYDTDKKSDYFILKYAGTEVTHYRQDGSLALDFESYDTYKAFDMEKWLTKLEKIVTKSFITLNGQAYLLTPIKEKVT